jgi:mRNA-degrading endonuclease RelE of RelBE toxin-antitoxin system
MDKLKKFIRFNPEKKKLILDTCKAICNGDTATLDIKKLEGTQNEYRCRIGKIRIKYRNDGQQIIILDVDYRGNIYK